MGSVRRGLGLIGVLLLLKILPAACHRLAVPGTFSSFGRTMAEDPTVTISDNSRRHRYEALIGHTLAAFATYRLEGDTITFLHTETEPDFEGHGVASHLAAYALDDARRRNLRVVAHCPFFATYIERHPDYADLLAPVD
jgi:hypothetical protein